MTTAYQIINPCHSELLGAGPTQPASISMPTLSCHEICSGLARVGVMAVSGEGPPRAPGELQGEGGVIPQVLILCTPSHFKCYLMFIREDHKAIWPSKRNTYLGALAEWVLVNSVSFPTLCLGERIVRRLVLLCWRDDRLDNFSMEHFQSLTMNGTSFLRGEKNRHRFSNASAGCKKMCWLAICIFDSGWLGHGRSQFNFYPCNIFPAWPYCTF